MRIAILMPAMLLTISSTFGDDTPLPVSAPEKVGMSSSKLNQIEKTINEGIKRGRLPGAVVLVLREGKIVYRKAIGSRTLEPKKELMTVDTVFDLASLTKPLASGLSILKLIEVGKLQLQDPVARYFPDFANNGKDKITIEHLLTHTSGLIADNSLKDYQQGPEIAWKKICNLKLRAEPGKAFIYSDVGFIVLGKLVEHLTKTTLDAWTLKNLYEPLKLKWTRFKPTAEMASHAAPTEKVKGRWLRGVVHDPRSRELGQVAGHAGLFSCADDLAVLAQMMLNEGTFNGTRILKKETVQLMTTPRKIPRGYRGLSWDMQTGYSSNRGKVFTLGSYGHTGFTGPSIWMDPKSQTAVIVLCNRVHPDGKGNVIRLRGEIATIVGESIVKPPLPGKPDK